MSEYAGKQSRSTSASTSPVMHIEPSPGKHTLVEDLSPAGVQRQSTGPDAAGQESTAVHAAAARGTATPASALPHRDLIQRAFGRHDVSAVQAHTGGEAAASATGMGARGYAAGNHVVLGQGADLFTEAHEAAHVVQQRGGVQLAGGIGHDGDPHERHADAVASLVVQGQSAEALLDEAAGSSAAASGGAPQAVQRQAGPGPSPSFSAVRSTAPGQTATTGSTTAQDPVQVATKLQKALDEGIWDDPKDFSRGLRPKLFKQESKGSVASAKARRAGAAPQLTGLGTISSVTAFAAAVRAAQAHWGKFPWTHAKQLLDAANSALRDAQIPEMIGPVLESRSKLRALTSFHHGNWSLHFQTEMLQKSPLTDDDAGALCAVTLHEARHAEQHWVAARTLADQGKSTADITTTLGIPWKVAAHAVAVQHAGGWTGPDADAQKKFGKDMEALLTGPQAQGTSNPGIQLKTEIDKLDAAHAAGAQALHQLQTQATPQTIAAAVTATANINAAIAQVTQVYHTYRAQKEEVNANDVGDAAKLAFDSLP